MNINDFELNVQARTGAGSCDARKLRNNGSIPVVIYNSKDQTLSGSIELKELQKALKTKRLFTRLTVINFKDGDKTKPITVFCKIMQKNPKNEEILHVDFQKVEKNVDTIMKIPVKFINQDMCEVIKLGGLLNRIYQYVEIKATPENMPESIDYDLATTTSKLKIMVKDFNIPENVKIVSKYQDKPIATILAAKQKAADKDASAG